MSTAEAWAGSWGSSYTARNRVDWRARVPFWRDVLMLTGARSVYEVGCNAGWNLSAIRKADADVTLAGVEANHAAWLQAHTANLPVTFDFALNVLKCYESVFDLTFTCGVLIHVPPDDIEETMRGIVNASADYVLAVEYHAEQEEEVLYRGQSGMLWRRPYGKLYQDMGLQLVKEWDAGDGFDRCTASLLRKPVTP